MALSSGKKTTKEPRSTCVVSKSKQAEANKIGPPSWTDGIMIVCTVPINLRHKGGQLKLSGTWIILGRWIFPTRRQNPKEHDRKECLKVCCAFADLHTGPCKKRHHFQEAVEMAKNLSNEEWQVPGIAEEDRERMYDRLDPTTKQNLIWLMQKWASHFHITESSSSASSWTQHSSWDWSDQHHWQEWREQPWEKQNWYERI